MEIEAHCQQGNWNKLGHFQLLFTEFIQIQDNEDDILEIKIIPGNRKPYYHKAKGLKSSGVYIRYGRYKTQASPEEISRMLQESSGTLFEFLISMNQDLTFEALKAKFRKLNMNFVDFKMITSGFVDKESNLYTNLAYWFSDQYSIDTKFAVYQRLDRTTFRSKQEFSGSIIEQIDEVMKYFDLCNEVRIIIDGKPTRTEIPSYNIIAARETILNYYCHRDYSRKSNIKIEFFDDRCKILSPGGFYGSLTLEKALEGYQSFRNEKLVKLQFVKKTC